MRSLLLTCLCCLALGAAAVASFAQGTAHLVGTLQPYYVLGEALWIEYDYTSTSNNPLQLDEYGLPTGMKLNLIGPDGPLARAPWGRPPNTAVNDPCPLAKGETVRLRTDIAELFAPTEAGHYRLQVDETEMRLTLVSSMLMANHDVHGVCTFPATTKRSTTFGLVVSGQAQVRKLLDVKPERWAITLEKPHITGLPWGWDQQFRPYIVPPGTHIKQMELDYKGQLWMVLELPGKRALLIWDLIRDDARLPIAWTREPIDFGSMRLTTRSYGRVVVAGIPGKVRLSSFSYER